MNLKFLPTILLLCVYSIISAQSEAAVWYFGENAGVDFNSGFPEALINGQLSTSEGCATISDENGALLFYTDGSKVWNRNHIIIPNGTGLKGNPSSSQSAVIVPNPANLNQYYIFTVQAISHRGGLFYSILDMTLDGGNGAIMSSQKNINLLQYSAEKIAAIEDHDNGYWILSYAGFAGDESRYDTFHAFKINDLGIDASITSTFSGCSTTDGRGYLKISADGTKVAICNQNQRQVCLYNFDTSTGVLEGELTLDTVKSPYSAEFSPSSEKMYVSTGGLFISDNAGLYQFDLTSSDIEGSRVKIHGERSKRGALQLGIDGKIYYARPGKTYLGVINDPENTGLTCNYNNEGVNLNGRKCKQGLPPFIQSYLLAGINANDSCVGETVEFSLDSSVAIDSVLWDFGDGNTSTLETPNHVYNTSGTYIVTAEVNSGSSTRRLNKEITVIEVAMASSVSNFYACDDSTMTGTQLFDLELKNEEVLGSLSSDIYSVSYFLNMQDVESHESMLPLIYRNTTNNQEIIAKLYNSNSINCYDTARFQLVVEQPAIAHEVADTIVCDDETNDGTQLINLSQFTTQILNTQQASNYNVTYHLTETNAINGAEALPESFQILNSPLLIYARIENKNLHDCYDTTSFEIVLSNYMTINNPDDMYLCDDESNDSVETFDLTLNDNQIISGLSGTYNITYYESEYEAETGTNAIVKLYNNTENNQEIFFRVEATDKLNCYSIGTFSLVVLEYEELQIEEMSYKCDNEPITLVADEGYDEYLWSNGETTREIIVDEIGMYEVTVTKYHATSVDTYCNYSKLIEVVESQVPTITNVEVKDWSIDNNGIIVIVEGNGDYEYSLDDFDYQDSNVFDGLKIGEYLIYIRDKNGCGKISDSFYALFYPKFFTPNGDGYHDYWQLYFSENEPDVEVSIFNRYGKLIVKLDSESKGWDGTLNGTKLPTSDYWFVVNRPIKNEQYKGHFTLKRK